MNPTELQALVDLVSRVGGWGVLVAFLWFGGRSFLSLAKDFATQIIARLDGIREAIMRQEGRDGLTHARLDTIEDKLDAHGIAISDVSRSLTQHIQNSKP